MTPRGSFSPGPSEELLNRIKHLQSLLLHLPSNLPDNIQDAESKYHFAIDAEKLEDCRMIGAVSHTLEVCFETFHLQGGPIVFQE